MEILHHLKKVTYSENFGQSQQCEDVGWSCMIRSGQMLLLNFLIIESKYKKQIFNDEQLLKLFLD